tara:strand:+ start:306 stop:437 length:132 start_codon:yes stop_codon:yes gene_type:complete
VSWELFERMKTEDVKKNIDAAILNSNLRETASKIIHWKLLYIK